MESTDPTADPSADQEASADQEPSAEPKPRIGVLTISDRAFNGTYEDRSGPAVEAALREYILTECDYERRLVPDEREIIADALRAFSRDGFTLVCTSGGTGPAPRDVTPEAMVLACDKLMPGFGEAMRAASLKQVPTAILSRQTAGIVGSMLAINLPGSPKAITCCLDAVFAAVPDCLDLMGGARIDANPDRVQIFRRHKKGDEKAHEGCDHDHRAR